MSEMFNGSDFDSDISNWKLNKLCVTEYMFFGGLIRDEYKPMHSIKEGFDFSNTGK
jgi:hypothetical protein